MLEKGQSAPDFESADQNGNNVRLSDFRGKKVVLYFYPKDNTPGCTKEACNLRDNYNLFINRGYVVIGVSPDSVDSHKRFESKFGLPFLLLSDPEKKIMAQYGTYGEKKMYGKTVIGVVRTTYIIDEQGIIEDIITKVKTDDHTNQILK